MKLIIRSLILAGLCAPMAFADCKKCDKDKDEEEKLDDDGGGGIVTIIIATPPTTTTTTTTTSHFRWK